METEIDSFIGKCLIWCNFWALLCGSWFHINYATMDTSMISPVSNLSHSLIFLETITLLHSVNHRRNECLIKFNLRGIHTATSVQHKVHFMSFRALEWFIENQQHRAAFPRISFQIIITIYISHDKTLKRGYRESFCFILHLILLVILLNCIRKEGKCFPCSKDERKLKNFLHCNFINWAVFFSYPLRTWRKRKAVGE